MLSPLKLIYLRRQFMGTGKGTGLHDFVRNSLLEGVRNFLLDFVRNFLMENVLRERYMVENVRNLLDFVRNFL